MRILPEKLCILRCRSILKVVEISSNSPRLQDSYVNVFGILLEFLFYNSGTTPNRKSKTDGVLYKQEHDSIALSLARSTIRNGTSIQFFLKDGTSMIRSTDIWNFCNRRIHNTQLLRCENFLFVDVSNNVLCEIRESILCTDT